MKKFWIFITLSIVYFSLFSQKNEIGLMVGNANLIGDIGKNNYIQPIPGDGSFSVGLLYRLNYSERQSLRLNVSYNKLSLNDNLSRLDYRIRRGTKEDQTIMEAALLYEYYFFDINDETKFAFSPYVFGGVGFYAYDKRNLYTITHSFYTNESGGIIIPPVTLPNYEEYFDTQETFTQEKDFDFSIPFGIGVKMKFSYNWLLMLEVGVRWTRNEYLDHNYASSEIYTFDIKDGDLNTEPFYDVVTQRNIDAINFRQTGNLTSYDWYVITGVGLTYTFGRPPCFCY